MIENIELLLRNAEGLLQVPVMVVPQIIIAVAIVIVGWIIGWAVDRILRAGFRALPFFDEALRSVGLEEMTKRAGLQVNLGKFFGLILRVFIVFVFLVAAFDVLGLESVNQFFVGQVLTYIPNVISAAFIVVIGLIIANFVANLVSGTSRVANVDGGLASKITKWSIMILSVLVALGELGIASEIIQSMVVGIIAAISLALGLAFGLGGQQAAADFLQRIKNDIERG